MFKNKYELSHYVLLWSILNFLFFHFPFFSFVFESVNYKSLSGILLITSLVVLMIVLNAFIFYILLYLSKIFGKSLLVIFFIINALSVYFVQTYSVIIDESMIGNILNTRYEEANSFMSFKLVVYIILLGIVPSYFLTKMEIVKPSFKKFLATASLSLLFILVLAFANATNWLWIDKNSKKLGGLAMPWSYTVNLSLFYIHKQQENKKEIRLPDATIANDKKSCVVLVIGESARSQNFSLYGYSKNTNPLLSTTKNLYHFDANACATYTTAAVKCILEHQNTNELYEILPNYLDRNNVNVIWRTTNWGEPPIHVKNVQDRAYLTPLCKGEDCEYDDILLTDLKEQIAASTKNKILIVLHTSTSHGPTYNKKYPPRFETFSPVCNSVQLANCTHDELINAYDNTIVYTDYLLHKVIDNLLQMTDFASTMIYVSDHGESLGEKNLYMHGVPMSFAPKEQYEIPFIVWVSDEHQKFKPMKTLSQHHVFHSVLHFLGINSSIYDESMNLFE